MFLSDIANEHLEQLLDIERTRGLRRIQNHLLRAPNIISDILTSILEIEMEKSRTNNFFLERKREQQFLEDTPLYIFIERVRADRERFPAAETREIVLLCEGRRLKMTENLAVLVAGVLLADHDLVVTPEHLPFRINTW